MYVLFMCFFDVAKMFRGTGFLGYSKQFLSEFFPRQPES